MAITMVEMLIEMGAKRRGGDMYFRLELPKALVARLLGLPDTYRGEPCEPSRAALILSAAAREDIYLDVGPDGRYWRHNGKTSTYLDRVVEGAKAALAARRAAEAKDDA